MKLPSNATSVTSTGRAFVSPAAPGAQDRVLRPHVELGHGTLRDARPETGA